METEKRHYQAVKKYNRLKDLTKDLNQPTDISGNYSFNYSLFKLTPIDVNYLPNELHIHSIRIGTMAKNLLFVNLTNYSNEQIYYTVTSTNKIEFEYNCSMYLFDEPNKMTKKIQVKKVG